MDFVRAKRNKPTERKCFFLWCKIHARGKNPPPPPLPRQRLLVLQEYSWSCLLFPLPSERPRGAHRHNTVRLSSGVSVCTRHTKLSPTSYKKRQKITTQIHIVPTITLKKKKTGKLVFYRFRNIRARVNLAYIDAIPLSLNHRPLTPYHYKKKKKRKYALRQVLIFFLSRNYYPTYSCPSHPARMVGEHQLHERI